ncbi:MAG: hypothetical protein KDK27_16605, partial [Leptospiraceae bacterium]|nr:hypothetical protein [Leptospiraceae bacterium]
MTLKKRLLGAGITLLGAIALLVSVPVFTQDQFDPTAVQPRGCDPAQFNCGYNPVSQERFAAIPPDDATKIRHRGLPSSADLSSKFPPVGNQGQQGSCVAWSTGYALKSYHEKVERNWAFDSPVSGGQGNRVFSPAYIYNQINGGRDGGSYIHDALGLMVNQGASPWAYMPYTSSNYTRQPSSQARNEAKKYRASNYRSVGGQDVNAIKSLLSQGHPIAFGMSVDDGFYNLKNQVYDRNSGTNYGGHAMTLVGYDDNKRSPRGERGAFKIINSWGTSWGDNGYGWISYNQWIRQNPQAYVLYDRTDSVQEEETEPDVPVQEEDEGGLQPPAEVTASKGTYADKVKVSWSGVSGAVAYAVMRAEPSNQNDFQFAAYAYSTSYDDASVQQGVAYRYLIIAINQQGYSDPQNSPVAEGYAGSGGNTNTAPGQVVGLSGQVKAVGGGGAVQLSWSEVGGAQSYQVVRYDSRREQWVPLGTARTTEHTDRNPPRDQEIYYSVRAVNNAGQGEWANPIAVSMGGTTTAPGIPSGLRATEGVYRNRIEISWDAVPGATKYYIFRYDYDDEEWYGPAESNTNSFTDDDSSVASGAYYAYTVAAGNSAGESEFADPVVGRANPNAQRGQELGPPQNVTGQINGTARTITIKWDAVQGATEYYIFRKE